MHRLISCTVFAALSASAAFSQSNDTRPTFLVADVHASPKLNQSQFSGPFYNHGRYEIQYATIVDLIRAAYDVDAERITGGPSWLEMDQFHIRAKAPEDSTKESRREMLRNLLADRFHLVVRHDTKEIPATTLTATKHVMLKESDGTGEGACNFEIQNPPNGQSGQGQPIQLPVISYTCRNTTMAAFAAGIPKIPGANGYLDNPPVVDQTELKGTYDFNLKITPKVPAAITVLGEKMPLPEALEKQLGLKIGPGKSAMPVIVVDSVDRKPTPNAPDVSATFPPPPTEFEVAELKPSAPTAANGGRQAQPEIKNGRLIVQNLTVQNLISIAWDLPNQDYLVGAPKWFTEARYDLIAQAPKDVDIGDYAAQQFNIDVLAPMVQNLLKERFKMKVHTEERPLPAYNLVAAKPKLTAADPHGRTKWKEGVGAAGKDTKNANPTLGRMVTCENMTMAQFADLLPQIANGYIHTPVLDQTGLDGAYDFTFSFTQAGALRAIVEKAEGGASGPSASEASDPSGGLSLLDALPRQLGLKLEAVKRPVPVLVIDHAEQ